MKVLLWFVIGIWILGGALVVYAVTLPHRAPNIGLTTPLTLSKGSMPLSQNTGTQGSGAVSSGTASLGSKDSGTNTSGTADPGTTDSGFKGFVSTASSQVLLCLNNVVSAENYLSQGTAISDPKSLRDSCDPKVYPPTPQDPGTWTQGQSSVVQTLTSLEQESWTMAQDLLGVNPNSVSEVQNALTSAQKTQTQVQTDLNTLTTYLNSGH